MHELSICTSLAAIVEEHAAGRPVDRVLLDIGHLRQVVPDTLAYSWEIVTADTPLAGSVLAINHIPAVISCHACGASTTVTMPVFRCACGSTDTELVAGRELLVTSLELADTESAPTRTAPTGTAQTGA